MLDVISFDDLNSLCGNSHVACSLSVPKTDLADHIVYSQLRPIIHAVNNKGSSQTSLLITGRNANPISMKNTIKPLKVDGGVYGEIEIKWGGSKDEVEFEAHIKGEIHDDRGNYGKVDFSQNDEGEKGLKISAGHEE